MHVQTKLAVAFLLSAILGGEAAAKDITIGFSWNQKESSLETAWEDYLKSEGKAQGEAAGVTIKWIFNVANGDPARQAANIEDLINKGVDIVMARAEDFGGNQRFDQGRQGRQHPLHHLRPRLRGRKAHSACRRRQL